MLCGCSTQQILQILVNPLSINDPLVKPVSLKAVTAKTQENQKSIEREDIFQQMDNLVKRP